MDSLYDIACAFFKASFDALSEKVTYRYRKWKLNKWLRKDFRNSILPEEIELELLEQEEKFPRYFLPSDKLPSTLETRGFSIGIDPTDVIFKDAVRCCYWVAVLIDNFLPESINLLPIEGRFALVLAQTEIRAQRNAEHNIRAFFRSYIGDELQLSPMMLQFLVKDVADWKKVKEWNDRFILLFEGGLYFSVILPIIKELCNKTGGKFSEENVKEFKDFLENLCNIELGIRFQNLDKNLLIFDGELLDKIGFVPVRETTSTVVNFIEEKFKRKCKNVIVLSRGFSNNCVAIEAILEAMKNLEYENISVGIKSVKLEESYVPGFHWSPGLRVFLCKNYKNTYLADVNKMKRKIDRVYSFIPHNPYLIMSKDPANILKIIRPIEKKLKKEKRIILQTISESGIDAACLIEIIRTISRSLHFRKDIIFFVSGKPPKINFCAELRLIK